MEKCLRLGTASLGCPMDMAPEEEFHPIMFHIFPGTSRLLCNTREFLVASNGSLCCLAASLSLFFHR